MVGAGYGPISDIEILWTAIASFGFGFAVMSGLAAIQDFKFLQRAEIFNGRRSIAKLGIFNELGRAYIQAVFVMVGIYAATNPEPPPDLLDTNDKILQAFVRWGFVTAAAMTAAKSFATWQVLRKLRKEAGH
jgi:hypothetical protein